MKSLPRSCSLRAPYCRSGAGDGKRFGSKIALLRSGMRGFDQTARGKWSWSLRAWVAAMILAIKSFVAAGPMPPRMPISGFFFDSTPGSLDRHCRPWTLVHDGRQIHAAQKLAQQLVEGILVGSRPIDGDRDSALHPVAAEYGKLAAAEVVGDEGTGQPGDAEACQHHFADRAAEGARADGLAAMGAGQFRHHAFPDNAAEEAVLGIGQESDFIILVERGAGRP